jgi:hypothetical protein
VPGKRKHEEPEEEPQPGTAAMAQGQPGAGVEGEPEGAHPEQPDNVVTGGEALEEQQQNPDLDDNSGARP